MRLLLIVICLLAAACGPRAETGNAARDAERAAIEVMASVDPGMPLDQMLLLLELAHLRLGVGGGALGAFRGVFAVADAAADARVLLLEGV